MRRAPIVAALLLFAAAPAQAVEAQRQVQFNAEPAAVWAVIGDFCGIGRWHPAIAECKLESGGKRLLTLRDGGEILERQIERDDRAMRYSYGTESGGPLPVSDDYRATLMVAEQGGKSVVTWRAEFTAKGATDAQAAEVMGGIFAAGLEGIRKQLRE